MTIKTFLAATGTAIMAGTTLLAAPAAATEPAAAEPAAPAIEVKLGAANGTGCKAEGEKVRVRSFASGVVELNLPQMKAKAGGNRGRSATLNCAVSLEVTPPAGYTYAVQTLGIKGFAYLDEGTAGKTIVTAFLAGQATTGKVSTDLTGEYRGRWVELDAPEPEIAATCGETRNLNVNARISADAGADFKNKTASMTLRSSSAQDHDVVLALRTVKCDA